MSQEGYPRKCTSSKPRPFDGHKEVEIITPSVVFSCAKKRVFSRKGWKRRQTGVYKV